MEYSLKIEISKNLMLMLDLNESREQSYMASSVHGHSHVLRRVNNNNN